MSNHTRPFWQILIVAAQHGAQVPLNCDECFLILEHLAEIAAQGADERYLLEAVRRHVERCPECRRHHLARLKELEARWRRQSPNSGNLQFSPHNTKG